MKATIRLNQKNDLMVRALPALDEIQRSIDRVIQRWPDAVSSPHPKEREKVAQDILRRITEWDWEGINTQRTSSAAMAVFDSERCNRKDLSIAHEFFYSEISACEPGPFLDAMVGVYIESFSENMEHTKRLARMLRTRSNDLGSRYNKLLSFVPDLLSSAAVPKSLASIMLESEDPFQKMKEIGFRSPHTSGLMQDAHQLFVKKIAKRLGKSDERKKLLNWLIPKPGVVLETGARPAIEALLAIWKDEQPPEELRKELSETIVTAYGDPRLHRGGIWTSFDSSLKSILLRWLTRQQMKYFCDMVTATQDSRMWGPRRDFWLELDDEQQIDEAWVAFGNSARQFAERHLLGEDIKPEFGRQLDRSGSTSLLVMRIGNKIVVDGCHSYKTHIFDRNDPKAPKLYQDRYFCDDIMYASQNSKPHNSIPVWKEWVRRHV